MKTIIIGIAGGTGSGKSTFTRKLKKEFKDDVAVLYHDNYYRDQSDIPLEERRKTNYDHPDAMETELLIRKKDRELFEDILSRTISRQLTDRIAESRKWVSDMSQLMKEMDTSMGLIFSLDWKPRRAENDSELDTAELEQILLRDRELLTIEDIEKVAAHFRSRIRFEKQRLEEDGGMVNYMELVRDALDYRKWFEFHMYFRRGEGERKLLTNAAFNRFSGGEKAMAMYVPLFSAVVAKYAGARKDAPKLISLDEAFAGVDETNIRDMFRLMVEFDFNFMINSQILWGDYDTVPGLAIYQLIRPENAKFVSVIRYIWNGKAKIMATGNE